MDASICRSVPINFFHISLQCLPLVTRDPFTSLARGVVSRCIRPLGCEHIGALTETP